MLIKPVQIMQPRSENIEFHLTSYKSFNHGTIVGYILHESFAQTDLGGEIFLRGVIFEGNLRKQSPPRINPRLPER